MSTPTAPALAAIRRSRVVAVLRAQDASAFPTAGRVLLESGIDCVEVTLTSEGALHAVARMAETAGSNGMTLGAGTVLREDDAVRAIDAGASFLISPALRPEVIEVGLSRGVPVIPGAATPSEIYEAWRQGAAAVKVFPASQLGGPGYLRAIRGPLPDIPLIPTGGIDIAAAADYLAAGAVAVGLGGPLVGTLSAHDLSELGQRAMQLRAAIDRG